MIEWLIVPWLGLAGVLLGYWYGEWRDRRIRRALERYEWCPMVANLTPPTTIDPGRLHE